MAPLQTTPCAPGFEKVLHSNRFAPIAVAALMGLLLHMLHGAQERKHMHWAVGQPRRVVSMKRKPHQDPYAVDRLRTQHMHCRRHWLGLRWCGTTQPAAPLVAIPCSICARLPADWPLTRLPTPFGHHVHMHHVCHMCSTYQRQPHDALSSTNRHGGLHGNQHTHTIQPPFMSWSYNW